MWEVLLEALVDTLKLFPWLLLAYILIEVIEKYWSHKMNRALTSKWSPLFGATFGLIPQCGFSVVATDLFSRRMLTMGTLIAIFIATSDEALPLLFANPDKIVMVLPLLGIKLIFAVILGFSIDAIFNKKRMKMQSNNQIAEVASVQEEHHTGCCGHTIEEEKENTAVRLLLHPFLHSLKILAYILVFNIIFGLIIFGVGEENFMLFLTSSFWLAPVLSAFIGLIPNCASSVILTELYLMGGLPFGGLLAGLCVNAGIALVILFQRNKNLKENLLITSLLFISSIIIGYLFLWI